MSTPKSVKSVEFSLDEPSETHEFSSGEVHVRGWAIPSTEPISIMAKIGNSDWVDVPYGRLRPDVAAAYPGNPKASHSGFGARISVINLQPGEHPFTLHIRSGPNVVSEVHRTIKITDPPTLARESYVSSSDDYLGIKFDDSSPARVVLKNSVVTVVGWAIAKSEIDSVEIWLNADGPFRAHYGLIREDIRPLYEDFPNVGRCGFLWASQTHHLAPGPHIVTAAARSKTGLSTQIKTSFELDHKSEYELWSNLNKLTPGRCLGLFENSAFPYTPKISVVTPLFKTPQGFLTECVESVKKQVYSKWELILIDDASRDKRLTTQLEQLAAGDTRIKLQTLPSNLGIAGATNEGIDLCSGEYVAFLDHDDVLSPDALLSIVAALNQDPSLDVLYSDEDKLDATGAYQDGLFKPQWSPDLLLSMNYICHFLVCRRSLLEKVGKLRLGFDGSQDYDLVLRLSEHTSKIYRIPKVLYHWRIHLNSAASVVDQKPAASGAGRRALQEHLVRKGIDAQVEETSTCRYRVRYKISGEPEVAIIIPSGGSPTLATALRTVLTSSTYRNYRIIIVDNSREGSGVADTVARFQNERNPIQLLDCRHLPFNFSKLCNKAVLASTSEHLLFLNDDTSVITPDWIESMLEHSQRPSVGAVGSLLLFPNGTIQHAGVINGLYEVAGHCFRGLPDSPFYFGFSHAIRNYSAVTGACLMTRRDVFESVNGFDERNLPTCFQDVDLCLKMVEQGYEIVYTPFAKLYHYESFSKRAIAESPEVAYMKERWASFIEDDPYYNPNLNRWADDYSLKYDQVFLEDKKKQASKQLSPALFSQRTASAKKLGRLGQIQFFATPEPAKTNTKALAKSTIFWEVTGIDKVQVRVGSPMGNVFAEGGPSGSAITGQWVSPGIVLYLLDATEGTTGTPEKVLSVLQL